MPSILECSSTLSEVLLNNADCKENGGVQRAAWALWGDIDWDATTWDSADGITSYTMADGGTFKKLEGNLKDGTYNSEYSQDTQLFTDTFQTTFKGGYAYESLKSTINTGCIVLHIFDRNCQEYVFGVDRYDDDFKKVIEALAPRLRLEGGSMADTTDKMVELDLVGESASGGLPANVGWDSMPFS